MKLNTKLFKTLFFLTFVFLVNCSKDDTVNLSEESQNSSIKEDNILKTVGLKESVEFFQDWTSSKTGKDNNPINLDLDMSTLRHENLGDNVAAKITVLDATTKFKELRSEALQLQVSDVVETVLLHKYKGAFDGDGLYSGLAICTDLEGNVHYLFKMKNDEIIGEYELQEFKSAKNANSKISYKWPDPCWGITCGIRLDEVILIPPSKYSPGIPRTRSPFIQGLWGGTNFQNTYAGYAAGYMQYQRYLESERRWKNVVIDSDGEKIDPKEELKCYDNKKGGKLTVYVQQPKENSLLLVGPNEVGHVFVGIEQDGRKKFFGFYPDSGASTALVAVNRQYPSEVRDNSGTLYHVSISASINANQMKKVLDYARNYPKNYQLQNYACTEFGVEMGNLAGLNLPKTTVKDPESGGLLFEGRSPAKLGQEIRTMKSDSKKKIKKTKGNAPSNTKDKC